MLRPITGPLVVPGKIVSSVTPSTVTRPPRRFPTDRLPDGGLLISRCGGVPALSWPVSTSPVCAAAIDAFFDGLAEEKASQKTMPLPTGSPTSSGDGIDKFYLRDLHAGQPVPDAERLSKGENSGKTPE